MSTLTLVTKMHVIVFDFIQFKTQRGEISLNVTYCI